MTKKSALALRKRRDEWQSKKDVIMGNRSSNFVDACINKEVCPEDIDNWIECWHCDNDNSKLHEKLGMTFEEYSRWVADPNSLKDIIAAHIEGEGGEES